MSNCQGNMSNCKNNVRNSKVSMSYSKGNNNKTDDTNVGSSNCKNKTRNWKGNSSNWKADPNPANSSSNRSLRVVWESGGDAQPSLSAGVGARASRTPSLTCVHSTEASGSSGTSRRRSRSREYAGPLAAMAMKQGAMFPQQSLPSSLMSRAMASSLPHRHLYRCRRAKRSTRRLQCDAAGTAYARDQPPRASLSLLLSASFHLLRPPRGLFFLHHLSISVVSCSVSFSCALSFPIFPRPPPQPRGCCGRTGRTRGDIRPVSRRQPQSALHQPHLVGFAHAGPH